MTSEYLKVWNYRKKFGGLKQQQNPFLTAQSTQIKLVISVPIKDFIHHYPRALFNDIPRVVAHFYDIPGSGRNFTTYPCRGAILRHTRVGAQFNDIPGSLKQQHKISESEK